MTLSIDLVTALAGVDQIIVDILTLLGESTDETGIITLTTLQSGSVVLGGGVTSSTQSDTAVATAMAGATTVGGGTVSGTSVNVEGSTTTTSSDDSSSSSDVGLIVGLTVGLVVLTGTSFSI